MLKYLKMPVKSDKGIQIATYILILFGLVMITSATMGVEAGNMFALVIVVLKQIVFIIIGYAAMNLCARLFRLEYLASQIDTIVIVTAFLLILPLFTSGSGGAKAWIPIPLPISGEVTIQPSEFAKLVVILIVANYLAGLKSTRISAQNLLKGPLTVLGGYFLIVAIFQKDFGSFAVMFVIAATGFLTCDHPRFKKIQKRLIAAGLIGFSGILVILSPVGTSFLEKFSSSSYMIRRFLSAANPFLDQYNSGYQLVNGLVSFSTGGLFGTGFGTSIRKYTDFPAANTDFILAIVVEELGFVGFLVIFLCYALIVYRLMKYALLIENQKGKVILIGVSMYFFVHFVFNVGGVTGLIPLTGVPLLLISAGGSSTMACLMGIGLAQSIISRYRRGEIK